MPSSSGKGGRGKGQRKPARGTGDRGKSTKKEQRPKGEEDVDEADSSGHDDDDAEGLGTPGAALRPTIHLCLWEFGQNDPKVDSGARLVRRGVARSMRPQAPFHGIVLSPMSNIPVSAADRELMRSAGLAGVNCSWNRVSEIPWDRLRRSGQHRILPWMVAANSINYGRPHKLNTAEAMAAALLIAGLKSEAKPILAEFAWGDEFVRLNQEVLVAYASAENGEGVKRCEKEFLEKCRVEAAERKAADIDLPPSESDGSSEKSDADDGDVKDEQGTEHGTVDIDLPPSEKDESSEQSEADDGDAKDEQDVFLKEALPEIDPTQHSELSTEQSLGKPTALTMPAPKPVLPEVPPPPDDLEHPAEPMAKEFSHLPAAPAMPLPKDPHPPEPLKPRIAAAAE